MTTEAQELVRKHLPILQAFAEGKTIQYRYRENSWRDWPASEVLVCSATGSHDYEYRIKPDPMLTARYRRYISTYKRGYAVGVVWESEEIQAAEMKTNFVTWIDEDWQQHEVPATSHAG